MHCWHIFLAVALRINFANFETTFSGGANPSSAKVNFIRISRVSNHEKEEIIHGTEIEIYQINSS